VAAAHHAGVFHRDLKPTNIMVSDDPGISDLKVTDFGIARMAADEIEVAVEGGEQSMQGSSTTMGALPFMAPEMIESPRLADKPADVWAVGTITCRLLLGSPPFGAGLRAVRKILDVEMPSKPSVLSSKPQFRSLGDELWSIIEKCLVREPDDRPTADELVALCSEVCYSRAPRSFGTITSVKTKGFNWGWIRNDANQSVFYHEQSYYGPASKEHQRVSFAAFEGQPSSRAFPVLPLREPAEE
jgi:serine/threonine-protein kinase